ESEAGEEFAVLDCVRELTTAPLLANDWEIVGPSRVSVTETPVGSPSTKTLVPDSGMTSTCIGTSWLPRMGTLTEMLTVNEPSGAMALTLLTSWVDSPKPLKPESDETRLALLVRGARKTIAIWPITSGWLSSGMAIQNWRRTPLRETTGSERHQPLPALTGIATDPSMSSAARAMRAKRRMLVLLVRPPCRESTGGNEAGRYPMGDQGPIK